MPIDTIYGNLQGLKPSQLKQLRRLYQQRLPQDCLTTPEFAQRLAAISTELQKAVCVYLNRRGQVIRVGVGSPRQTQIPLLELPRYGAERLCGIRCLATTLKKEPPKRSSLTAMAIQRLDALVVLTLTGQGFQRRGGGATGYVKEVYLAHLLPPSASSGSPLTPLSKARSPLTPLSKGGKEGKDGKEGIGDRGEMSLEETGNSYWMLSDPMSLETLTQQDFLDLIEGLEEEFRREFVAQAVDEDQDRVLLVGLQTEGMCDRTLTETLTEVGRLVTTAGGEVLHTIVQKRAKPHTQTVVGSGKVEEIALAVQTLGANLVVFDRDLSPAQVRNLEKQFGVRVCDRTEVILDIFAQRARSGAGKLQVELAQLNYMMPRLTGRGQAMSRLGGGIGTRGPGETKLETERRTLQQRITRLQKEVNQLQAHRSRLRQQRQKQEVPTIAIVGYTNAGKSTLINALTNATVYTADQLFATLDPTTRRLVVESPKTGEPLTLLLTDTVGFIHELPPSLMDAFRATLEEVIEADVLLHLVDLSHPAWQHQIESVTEILEEMPLIDIPILLAFNKLDQVSSEVLTQAKKLYPDALYVAAQERIGLETLRQTLADLVVLSL